MLFRNEKDQTDQRIIKERGNGAIVKRGRKYASQTHGGMWYGTVRIQRLMAARKRTTTNTT